MWVLERMECCGKEILDLMGFRGTLRETSRLTSLQGRHPQAPAPRLGWPCSSCWLWSPSLGFSSPLSRSSMEAASCWEAQGSPGEQPWWEHLQDPTGKALTVQLSGHCADPGPCPPSSVRRASGSDVLQPHGSPVLTGVFPGTSAHPASYLSTCCLETRTKSQPFSWGQPRYQ